MPLLPGQMTVAAGQKTFRPALFHLHLHIMMGARGRMGLQCEGYLGALIHFLRVEEVQV